MVADWFNTVWGWVVAVAGGVSYSAILTTIICIVLKGTAAKARQSQAQITKEVQKEACETAIKEGLGAIKTKVHKHDIEPLVEARLKDVAKITSEEQVKALKEIHEENQKLVLILEQISKLFDNSFYISEETKQELKNTIAEAKDETEPELVESEVVNELVSETPNTENNTQNESHKTTSIER